MGLLEQVLGKDIAAAVGAVVPHNNYVVDGPGRVGQENMKSAYATDQRDTQIKTLESLLHIAGENAGKLEASVAAAIEERDGVIAQLQAERDRLVEVREESKRYAAECHRLRDMHRAVATTSAHQAKILKAIAELASDR